MKTRSLVLTLALTAPALLAARSAPAQETSTRIASECILEDTCEKVGSWEIVVDEGSTRGDNMFLYRDGELVTSAYNRDAASGLIVGSSGPVVIDDLLAPPAGDDDPVQPVILVCHDPVDERPINECQGFLWLCAVLGGEGEKIGLGFDGDVHFVCVLPD